MNKYPLHEKLKAHEHEAHVLGGFLDMLDEQRLVLAKYHEHGDECYDGDERECGLRTEQLYDFGIPTKEQLIGLYLEIDPKGLSAEKDAMYQEIVAANSASKPSAPWKQKAIEAAELAAKEDEAKQQERLAGQKERAAATFKKYLTNCGVSFNDGDIQFEIVKGSGLLRTFAVIDDVEFTTKYSEYAYEGCAVMHGCKECGARVPSVHSVNNPAALGAELINPPQLAYHRCDPIPTNDSAPKVESTSERLLALLEEFIAERMMIGV